MKIRKGDNVIVIAGRDKGATGKVIQAFPKTDKVLVEGVNKIKSTWLTPLLSVVLNLVALSPRKHRFTCPTS